MTVLTSGLAQYDKERAYRMYSDLHTFLLIPHSIVRWVIILVILAAIIRFALVWARRLTASDKTDRAMMSAYSGLLDLQALLGFGLLLPTGLPAGALPSAFYEHAGIMILAVIAGHLPMRWRKADGVIRARNNLIAIAVSLLLIVVAVSLVNGWMR